MRFSRTNTGNGWAAVGATVIMVVGFSAMAPAAGVSSSAPAAPLDAVHTATGAAASTAAAPTALTQKLDALLADQRYVGSQVGLVVRDVATGEELYDRNGGNRLLPASNQKLFTSTAALHALGPSFRFHTDVYADGAANSGGILQGSLYLKGFGDPTSLADDYAALARQVAASGVRQVKGDLVVDDTYFDSVRLAPFWSWDDEPYYYSAQTSALTVAPNTDYDSGTAIVESRPGSSVGAPVVLSTVPQTGVLHIVSTATTGAAGSPNTLSIEREHGSNVVTVTGSVPLGSGVGQEWVTVWDPQLYAGDVFRRALADAGVRVSGRLIAAATPDSAGTRLARDESMILAELMTPFLKLSNNMHAEALIKTMGAQASGTGSWPAGIAVVKSYAASLGVNTATLRIVDGSGLSRGDNLTADAIADLLVGARSEPWFDTWYAALPIAGNSDRMVGGTLRSRMAGTAAANNLHAKTGSMTGVTGLSGYVTDADGRLLAFSMLSNNYLSSPRSVEDAVGATLATYSAAAAGSPARLPQARVAPGSADTDRWAELECSWRKAAC